MGLILFHNSLRFVTEHTVLRDVIPGMERHDKRFPCRCIGFPGLNQMMIMLKTFKSDFGLKPKNTVNDYLAASHPQQRLNRVDTPLCPILFAALLPVGPASH